MSAHTRRMPIYQSGNCPFFGLREHYSFYFLNRFVSRAVATTTALAAISLSSIALLLASSESTHATTVSVVGSYTVTYIPDSPTANGNAPTFTYAGDLNHMSFTENLTLGAAATSPTNFFTINPAGSCGSNCIKSANEGTVSSPKYYYMAQGTVSVTFSFSNLTVIPATSNLTETGLYQAKYGGLPLGPCAVPSGSGDTDCITWKTTAAGGHDPLYRQLHKWRYARHESAGCRGLGDHAQDHLPDLQDP